MDKKDKDSFPGVDAYIQQLIRDEFSSNSQPPVVM